MPRAPALARPQRVSPSQTVTEVVKEETGPRKEKVCVPLLRPPRQAETETEMAQSVRDSTEREGREGGREDMGRADSELGTLPERGDAQTHTWSKGNRDHRGMEHWDTAGEQGCAP